MPWYIVWEILHDISNIVIEEDGVDARMKTAWEILRANILIYNRHMIMDLYFRCVGAKITLQFFIVTC